LLKKKIDFNIVITEQIQYGIKTKKNGKNHAKCLPSYDLLRRKLTVVSAAMWGARE